MMARILVIDDEKIIRERLKNLLELDNYEVFIAEDGKKGLDIFQKERPEIVLVDIKMPGMDGIEALRRIKGESRETEVIMITGHGGVDTVIEALREGAFGYIEKPIEYDEIEIEIKKALEKQETHRKLDEYVRNLRKAVEEITLVNERLQSEIARRKQLEQNAKLAAVGKLAAGIAHEINNPLSFIYANLENLNKFILKVRSLIDVYDELDMPEETKKAIEEKKEEINYTYLKSRITDMIEKSIVGADRMRIIVMSMRTFSRVDRAEVGKADINESIDATLGILIHEYKERIKIKKEYDKQLPPVKCFVAKLNQVLLNLLVNACQAIDGKGVIIIRTGTEDGNVVIAIEDSGCGMPDDVKDNIFNPFFTTKLVGQGTGLGLSISHEIIQQHHGELSVKSKVGQGSVFTIKIPICSDLIKEVS